MRKTNKMLFYGFILLTQTIYSVADIAAGNWWLVAIEKAVMLLCIIMMVKIIWKK